MSSDRKANPFITLLEQPTYRRSFLSYMSEDKADYDDEGCGIHLELGRQQIMPILTSPYPTQEELSCADPDSKLLNYTPMMQITIRDITLPKHMRGQGIFRDFVNYLLSLPDIQAVQVEAVMNRSLQQKMESDPRWIRQTTRENDFNPSYVILKPSDAQA